MREETLWDDLDRVTDGFISFDREWRFTWLNQATADYFRRPRDELLGRVVWEVFPSTLASDAERELRRAAASPAPTEFELIGPVMRRCVAFRCFPSPRGLTVYFRDVTEHRERDRQLEEAEARYRSLFENSLDGILLTAPTGEVYAANPAACRMLQRTEAELLGGGRMAVVDPTDPRLPAALAERRRLGSLVAELHLVRKDGTRFPALISSGIFRIAGGGERTSMVFHDLSGRVRAEQRLQFLASAGAQLGGSLELEHTLRVVEALAVPFLAGRCVVELTDGAGAGGPDRALTAATARVLHTGEPVQLSETDLVLPLSARGRTLGVMALLERRLEPPDVALARTFADRAAVAIENCQLFARAVDSRRVRDEVLGIVSHDLRAPLSTISLSAGLLASRSPGPEVASIVRAVSRADRLIDDLLTTAQIEAGELSVERGRERVGELLDEVVELHRPAAKARQLELSREPGDDAAEVWVDRHRVSQMLSNLVSNSIKFTDPGGAVRLRARVAGGNVVFSVSDTGSGISPDALEHIWDRFWQAAHARKAGVGLGLAIVRGIAQAHGGTVEVESVLDRGSTFTCILPARMPAQWGERRP